MELSERDQFFDEANAEVAVGELDNAVVLFRRAIQIDPNFVDGWHALGMALMKLGRYREAIDAGLRATQLNPNDQILWTSLSLAYNRNGQIPEAEAANAKARILSWGGKLKKTAPLRTPPS